ncbi:MAG: hypothetical protein K0R58_20 [Ramlibacter sp.]|jgi:hypothetical protein|nr:hypothetical protein [Ramlibacter sp.]
MNPHRRHYLDLNPPPGSWFDTIGKLGAARYVPDWILVVLAIALLAAHWVASSTAPDPAATIVTPIRTPVVEHYTLPSLDVAEARIEGFRAGVAAAGEQCTPLSHPLATR